MIAPFAVKFRYYDNINSGNQYYYPNGVKNIIVPQNEGEKLKLPEEMPRCNGVEADGWMAYLGHSGGCIIYKKDKLPQILEKSANQEIDQDNLFLIDRSKKPWAQVITLLPYWETQ